MRSRARIDSNLQAPRIIQSAIGVDRQLPKGISLSVNFVMEAYFRHIVFPVLTPLAFDPGRPFPHISNLSLNLAVVVRRQRRGAFCAGQGPEYAAPVGSGGDTRRPAPGPRSCGSSN